MLIGFSNDSGSSAYTLGDSVICWLWPWQRMTSLSCGQLTDKWWRTVQQWMKSFILVSVTCVTPDSWKFESDVQLFTVYWWAVSVFNVDNLSETWGMKWWSMSNRIVCNDLTLCVCCMWLSALKITRAHFQHLKNITLSFLVCWTVLMNRAPGATCLQRRLPIAYCYLKSLMFQIRIATAVCHLLCCCVVSLWS